jgi:hypothetical protein
VQCLKQHASLVQKVEDSFARVKEMFTKQGWSHALLWQGITVPKRDVLIRLFDFKREIIAHRRRENLRPAIESVHAVGESDCPLEYEFSISREREYCPCSC